MLLCGRLLYGFGIGTAMHVAPLFIGETAPDNLRGKLVSLKEAAIVLGIVYGYYTGTIYGATNDWHGVFKSAVPFEAAMIAGAIVIPESPRWLALRGRPSDAVNAVRELQGCSEVEATKLVEEMLKFSSSANDPDDEDSGNVFTKVKEIFDSQYNRRALFIGVGLVLLQQLSGQPSVLYFANRIFEDAGFGFEAAVAVGVFKLIMTLVSSELVEDERWGRRSLLLLGNTVVTLSLLLLTTVYGLAGADGPNQIAVISCIIAFVGGYQIGFGPITWLVLSEIFPLRIRSAAVSIGTLVNFGSNLLVASIFELERVSIGENLLFGQFFLVALASVLFTYINVFETRGLSLEEIEDKLKTSIDEE